MAKKTPKQDATSWGAIADWYADYLATPDSYQAAVIAPNLLRILNIKKRMRILDIACGEGFFTRLFQEAGADAVGADIAKELIAKAKKRASDIPFHVAPADKLSFAHSAAFDAAVIILALQNIQNIDGVCTEAARVLRPQGRFIIILNHPAFRIPKRSSWGWEGDTQYRRIDGYLSASTEKIDMHPGKKGAAETISFHRSLQDICKPLFKHGFAIMRLEEWTSHKKSEPGPRQKAEDTARKEIPLFLLLEATKK